MVAAKEKTNNSKIKIKTIKKEKWKKKNKKILKEKEKEKKINKKYEKKKKIYKIKTKLELLAVKIKTYKTSNKKEKKTWITYSKKN